MTLPAASPPPDPGPVDRRYERLALAVLFAAIMMTAIDTTAVILALPTMLRDLHTGLVTGIWIIMAYLLILATLGTQVGRLGDMFGRVRIFNTGFFVFVGASILCAVAANGAEIIAFRAVQGVGGAMLFANSGAIIADTFPPRRRGAAYGLTGVGYSTGAILGILVGGILTTFASWRWIFLLNLPVGLIAGLVAYRVLRERAPRVARRLDLVGMAFLTSGLVLVLTGIAYIAGFGPSLYLDGVVGLGGALVVAFVVWEARFAAEPLLDLGLLKRWTLTASIFAAFFQSTASLAVLFVVIMYLQGVRGLSPFAASVLLVPGYLLGAAIAPFAGRSSDRYGARLIASIGLVLQVVGIAVYATLGTTTALGFVVLGSVVSGSGNSAFYPSNNSEVMTSAPPGAYGVASGLLRMFTNVGTVSSFAIALLVVALSIPRTQAFAIFLGVVNLSPTLYGPFITGMHAVLAVAIAFVAIALILSVLRGRRVAPTTAPPGAGPGSAAPVRGGGLPKGGVSP
jgi:EmrB/QacA subfamily drug resistance transporter